MKKKITILGILVVATLLFSTCDYVTNANKVPTTVNTGSTTVVYRKILIEDYTGHKCGNCPAAAIKLTSLEGTYGAEIIPIAVHANFQAQVSMPNYPTNFNTQAGTDWDNTFSMALNYGNPCALFNRVNHSNPALFGSNDYVNYWTFRTDSLNTIYKSGHADFQIKIVNTFNTSTNQLNSKITTKALSTKTGVYNLVVVLTEDSIIAEQEDYSINAINPHYVFNHVLRGAIDNNSWGSPLVSGTINANDSIVKPTYNYTLPSTYNYKHCHVIAFIYDAAPSSPTYYEIMQVETATLY